MYIMNDIQREECASSAREIAAAYLQLAEHIENGATGIPLGALRCMLDGTHDWVMACQGLGREDVEEPVATALRQLIPVTCLPTEIRDHQELADMLVIALSGDLALVPKHTYDDLVVKTQGR